MVKKLWVLILIFLLNCSLIKAPRPEHITVNNQLRITATRIPGTVEEVYIALQEGRAEDVVEASPELFRDEVGVRMLGEAYTMLGEYNMAEKQFLAARAMTKDEKFNSQICEDLVWLALARGDYNSATRWQADLSALCDIKTNPITHLWSKLAFEADSILDIPDHPVILPVIGKPFPRANIKVNGHESNFFFDTGAGMMAISASRVKAWKLPIISLPDTAHGLGKIVVRYTIIDKLEMGEVVLTNIPAVVIDDKDLTFTVLGIFKIIDIPGIVGLPVLSRMKFTIDMPRKKIILEKSEELATNHEKTLIYWRNQIYIPVFLAEMGRLDFFVDTGANRSSLSFDTSKRLPADAKVDLASHDLAQGAGGVMSMAGLYQPGWMALDGMFMEGLGLDLESRTREHENELLNRDGTLGMDILQCFTVTVDIPARFIEFTLPTTQKDK